MKPEQIHEELKALSEKMGVTVREQNFRSTGVKAKSGYCKVKDQRFFIMDKHKSLKERNDLLASFLKGMPHEDVFVVPAIRDFVKHAD